MMPCQSYSPKWVRCGLRRQKNRMRTKESWFDAISKVAEEKINPREIAAKKGRKETRTLPQDKCTLLPKRNLLTKKINRTWNRARMGETRKGVEYSCHCVVRLVFNYTRKTLSLCFRWWFFLHHVFLLSFLVLFIFLSLAPLVLRPLLFLPRANFITICFAWSLMYLGSPLTLLHALVADVVFGAERERTALFPVSRLPLIKSLRKRNKKRKKERKPRGKTKDKDNGTQRTKRFFFVRSISGNRQRYRINQTRTLAALFVGREFKIDRDGLYCSRVIFAPAPLDSPLLDLCMMWPYWQWNLYTIFESSRVELSAAPTCENKSVLLISHGTLSHDLFIPFNAQRFHLIASTEP